MSFQYLQSQQHYENRYDVGTIKECLRVLDMIDGIGEKMKLEPKFQNYPESEQDRNMGLFRGRMLFFIQAQRHKHRTSTIAEWIESDRSKQDKQDNICTQCVILHFCETRRKETVPKWSPFF